MAIINFSITKPMEQEMKQAIKERGFSSKAEFFRFAAWQLIEENKKTANRKSYEQAVKDLTAAILKKTKGKKLPPLEDQLADL